MRSITAGFSNNGRLSYRGWVTPEQIARLYQRASLRLIDLLDGVDVELGAPWTSGELRSPVRYGMAVSAVRPEAQVTRQGRGDKI